MPSGSIVLKVKDREFKRHLQRATAVGLKRAGVYYQAKCREAVSRHNVPTPHKRKRDTSAQGGGPIGSQYSTWDDSSRAGEPPRRRTGFGQKNIVMEFNDNAGDPAVRVGVVKSALYMIFLELGTRHITPRPWLVATLMKYRRTIGMLAVTGGKGSR